MPIKASLMSLFLYVLFVHFPFDTLGQVLYKKSNTFEFSAEGLSSVEMIGDEEKC